MQSGNEINFWQQIKQIKKSCSLVQFHPRPWGLDLRSLFLFIEGPRQLSQPYSLSPTLLKKLPKKIAQKKLLKKELLKKKIAQKIAKKLQQLSNLPKTW